jgi:hypothetical protein
VTESSDRPVGKRSDRRVGKCAEPSLALACLLLAAAVTLAAGASGYWAYARHGSSGLAAVAIAAVACWIAATGALLLAGWLRNTPHSVSGILGGTLLRISLPLVAAAGCKIAAPALFQVGLLGYLLLFFLLTLVVETLLLVWLLRFGRSLSPRSLVAAPGLPKAS